jgi:pimeloyl-ACP methyl ester carboxylesterase
VQNKTVWIFTHGILNCPGWSKGITDQQVTWVIKNLGLPAEKFEYTSDALFRWVRQPKRIRDYTEFVNQFGQDWTVNLVGHSNGCDIICRALPSLRPIESLHLLSGACEADCWANGINSAMMAGKLTRVTCYVAGKDCAMKAAWLSRALRCIGLGYGTLGLTGPLRPNSARIVTVREQLFGHSEWFDGENFEKTMRRLTQGASAV